jgi:putative flippase GtrA
MTAQAEFEQAEAGDRWSRLIRFVIVGLAGTGVYFGAAAGLVLLGMDVRVAHWAGFAVSQVASYFGQKKITFGIDGDHRRMGTRFVAVVVILASAQFLIVSGMAALRFQPLLGLAASTAFYPAGSLLLHFLWTFRPAKPEQSSNAAQ